MRTAFLDPLEHPFSKMNLDIDGLRQYIRNQRKAIVDFDGEVILLHYALNDLRDARAKLEKMERMAKQPQGKLTDDMIQRAREYPIEQVVEFVKGKATAFCHPDKNPSLHHDRKHNRAHCFPCGKSFSALDVLILRDNLSFNEAVKRLCGG